MLKKPYMNVHGSLQARIAQVMKISFHPFVAIGLMGAVWASAPFEIPAWFDNLWFWKILDPCDSLFRIRWVFPRFKHFSTLQVKNSFSPEEIYKNWWSPKRKTQFLCYSLIFMKKSGRVMRFEYIAFEKAEKRVANLKQRPQDDRRGCKFREVTCLRNLWCILPFGPAWHAIFSSTYP